LASEGALGAGGAASGWPEWTERARGVCLDLLRRAVEPLSILRDAAPDGEVEARGWARFRVWRHDGFDPRAVIEQGVRLTLRRPGARAEIRSGPQLEWIGADPQAAPWLVNRSLAHMTSSDPSLPLDYERVPIESGYEGPALLLPRAAARWVHEMAHAGIERSIRCESRAAPGAGRIVDDPRGSAWPFGFEADDHGDAAGRIVLWGDGASDEPAAGRGHRRRASVREPAIPSLSVTRLEPCSQDPVALSDLPPGTPVVMDAGAARFEPTSGTVLIDALIDGGESEPVQRALLRSSVEQGWVGSKPVDLGDERRRSERLATVSAACTRLGQRHHVLVGAPTIVLDRVLL